jgi:hypothetical protein
LLDTVPAVAVKLAVVAPEATVTEAGTGSAALLDESPTEVPPAAAACDNVTVQVEVAPDTTDFGEHCSPLTVVVTVPPPEVTGVFMSVTTSAAESARL